MLKVVQVGLGPLGQKVVRYVAGRDGLKIVAAVDKSPDKIGRDLGELCGLSAMNLAVAGDLRKAVKGTGAQVAILTTVSSVSRLAPQVEAAARAGLHVVSTCEELSFPWKTNPSAARRIDHVCRRHGVACVGTGVNPGFLMDFLPVVMTSVCQNVRRIRVSRIQDASARRIPFQQKIGAGLARAEFKARVAEGTLRHVGLTESMHMIAAGMNWKLDRTTESLQPVIARRTITSGHVRISAGQACGVEQIGRGFQGHKEVIRLHFRAAVGEKESADIVEIDGEPSFRSVIPGGVNGDVATCAITVNALRAIARTGPGLKTMLDLPVPGYFCGV